MNGLFGAVVAIAAACTIPTRAFADGVPLTLEITLSNLSAEVESPPLSPAYTGRVTFFSDANDSHSGPVVDGVTRPFGGFLEDAELHIEYDAGVVISGYFVFNVVELPGDLSTTYLAHLDPGAGAISDLGGKAFDLDLFAHSGGFSRDTYAGGSIVEWRTGAPLSGPIEITSLRLNSEGLDPNCEILLTIPEPKGLIGPADLNHDGVVDSSDLAIVLAAWSPFP